ncbi:Chk1 protein kinase [Terramyces sp. JEL0728]|nr:Chk1 protein kinase [Terramyces sp. JEL0728]
MVRPENEILGYELGEDIGEGGQARLISFKSRVRLGFNQKENRYAAIKIIPKVNSKGQLIDASNAQKELKIHKSVSHKNIIKLFNTHQNDLSIFLIMEYAAGGELFDRIEPDIGIDEQLAHLYFQQLIMATEYLHSRGIAHRDLKPENMLLDERGNLKLTDFGLATVYKYQGNTRLLTTPCGTPPYVAPEIHTLSYQGDQVDIWSSGIILYVLLSGNTPWAEPTSHDEEFTEFVKRYPNNLDYLSWSLFSDPVFELLLGILNINPTKRFTITDIKKNQWVATPNDMLTDGACNNPEELAERLMAKMSQASARDTDLGSVCINPSLSYSQPSELRKIAATQEYREVYSIVSFSQPVHYSTAFGTPTKSQRVPEIKGAFVDIFPSAQMARFYSDVPIDVICQRLCGALDEFLVPFNKISSGKITFTTVDKRKCQIHGDIVIQPTTEANIVSFRKRKGDPLEFKRFYKAVTESIEDIVLS